LSGFATADPPVVTAWACTVIAKGQVRLEATLTDAQPPPEHRPNQPHRFLRSTTMPNPEPATTAPATMTPATAAPATAAPATMTPATAAPASSPRGGGPRYPQVRVRVSGDGNAHILIGKVAVALRRQVGDAAADAFHTAARSCDTYQQVLDLVRTTVRTR
jgi:hypothetical protein